MDLYAPNRMANRVLKSPWEWQFIRGRSLRGNNEGTVPLFKFTIGMEKSLNYQWWIPMFLRQELDKMYESTNNIKLTSSSKNGAGIEQNTINATSLLQDK